MPRQSTREVLADAMLSPLRALLMRGEHRKLAYSLPSFRYALSLGLTDEDLFQAAALAALEAEVKYPFDASRSKASSWLCIIMNSTFCKLIRKRVRKYDNPFLQNSAAAEVVFPKLEAPIAGLGALEIGELRRLAAEDKTLSWHAREHVLCALGALHGFADFEPPAGVHGPGGKARLALAKKIYHASTKEAEAWIRAQLQGAGSASTG